MNNCLRRTRVAQSAAVRYEYDNEIDVCVDSPRAFDCQLNVRGNDKVTNSLEIREEKTNRYKTVERVRMENRYGNKTKPMGINETKTSIFFGFRKPPKPV